MRSLIVAVELLATASSLIAAAERAAPPGDANAESGPAPVVAPLSVDQGSLPYVYRKWEHYTVKEGLPNDHIFAVKAAGPLVWIGTENGLACLDKRTGKIRSWGEKDGLPWRVITALDFNEKTGELWIGLFGGGLARFSGGRFDHWNQLNSGLVNDVVYGVAVENDNVWVATTAGASRYNTITGEWSVFTERNAPMEEIWNYGVSWNKDEGKVFLAIWGSGVLEYNTATKGWKTYLDPDGEMEIDLYRDDGLVHVITTAASSLDGVLWVSTYFGMSRYDGRNWRGYYAHETGLPSDFANSVKGRSRNEAWFSTDKGSGVLADFPTDTWVTYTVDPKTRRGKAVVRRGKRVIQEVDMARSIPHNFVIYTEFDGPDVWVGTAKGLGRGVGSGYYQGLKARGKAAADEKKSKEGGEKR